MKLKKYITKQGWKEDWNQTKKDFRKAGKFAKKVGETAYWDLYYTTGYSSMAGLGNGMANAQKGESFKEGFGEAYINNFPLGMAVNLAYPLIFNKLKKSKNYRLYANLATLGINAGFLAWHYLTGTENPVQAMIPNTLVGLAMANGHVSQTKKKNLEKAVD